MTVSREGAPKDAAPLDLAEWRRNVEAVAQISDEWTVRVADVAALLAEIEQWREVYEKLVMEYDAETERLRGALRTAATRLEILQGRMRACGDEHAVSLIEIPGWIEEQRAILSARASEEGQ
jgi:hypothetical protein